jgi:hypothetical protein
MRRERSFGVLVQKAFEKTMKRNSIATKIQRCHRLTRRPSASAPERRNGMEISRAIPFALLNIEEAVISKI